MKKEGDKYYKTDKKITDFAYQNQGITRYFYDDIALIEIYERNFKLYVLKKTGIQTWILQ